MFLVFKKTLAEKKQKKTNITNNFKHYLEPGLTQSEEVFKLEVKQMVMQKLNKNQTAELISK